MAVVEFHSKEVPAFYLGDVVHDELVVLERGLDR